MDIVISADYSKTILGSDLQYSQSHSGLIRIWPHHYCIPLCAPLFMCLCLESYRVAFIFVLFYVSGIRIFEDVAKSKVP